MGDGADEGLGADPGPAGEDALEVEGGEAHRLCRVVQRGMVLPVVGQPAERALHPVIVARAVVEADDVG